MTLFLSLNVGDSLRDDDPEGEKCGVSCHSSRELWRLGRLDSRLSCSVRLELQCSTTISGRVRGTVTVTGSNSVWIWSSVVSESVLYCLNKALLSIRVLSRATLTGELAPRFWSEDSESQLGDLRRGLGLRTNGGAPKKFLDDVLVGVLISSLSEMQILL